MQAGAGTLWLARPTRYAALGHRRAWRALALLLVLLAASLASLRSAAPPPIGKEPAARAESRRDVQLYAGIVRAVRNAQNYYPAAASALRSGNYPLRPFFTFRLPTLAWAQALLPLPAILALLYALVAAVLLGWAARLRAQLRHWRATAIALALLAAGLPAFVQAELWPFHEIWAGLLIALSLALRRPGHPAAAIALGLAAALIRETAGLYLLVMALLAWRDGHRREALGWGATLVLLATALALHASAAGQVTTPLDPASPGWSGLLGFGFFVNAARAATGLATLPPLLAAPLIGLALFGWTAWRDPVAARVTATLAAYAALLAIFARADTFYWVFLVAPLVPLGLVFAPDALRDLWRSAFPGNRQRAQGTR